MSFQDSAVASVAKKKPTALHLIYDEVLAIKKSKFRYRIWAGKDRFPVVLVNDVDKHSPIRVSAQIATSLFNSHVSKLVPYDNSPFYYIEAILPLKPKKITSICDEPLFVYPKLQYIDPQEEPVYKGKAIVLIAYEFDRTIDEFWNPRARCIEISYFENFVGCTGIEL